MISPEYRYETDYNHLNMLNQTEYLDVIEDVDKFYVLFDTKMFELINLTTISFKIKE